MEVAELKAAVETTALAAVTSKKQDSRATTVAVAATMMKGLAPGERKLAADQLKSQQHWTGLTAATWMIAAREIAAKGAATKETATNLAATMRSRAAATMKEPQNSCV